MNQPARSERRDSWILKFHDLMPHRIREVLLVSSDYDAYVIEEDGRLSERLFVEYSELNLTTSPRFLHVSGPEEAMHLLRQRRVDLVLTTLRLDDPGVRNLAERVKSEYPNLPVALMVLDEFELRRLPHRQLPGGVDGVFLWTGDTRIMLAILKLIEDSLNVAEDTGRTGVQVIIVVEDSVRRYSTFLAQLYAELMIQSQSLVAEGVNAMHRMLRMMARPKILLATNYEEAWALFERFQRYTLAVISDVQYPRGGRDDEEAGFELARAVRAVKPNLPILIQSANPENAQQAHEMGLQFVDKNSETLLRSLTWFLKENLGFSDFVFRLPDRTEVARARDMYELEQVLRKVDVRSIYYHASRNHFNVWLRARSMFELADEVEAVQASAFEDPEQLREYLVGALHRAACQEQEGVVADFSRRSEGPTRHFVKIGGGSIGGKGRGVAFLNSRLARRDLDSDRMGMAVAIPRTVVIGTDEFDRFLEHNGLGTLHASHLPEKEVQRRVLEGELPRSVVVDLRAATREMRGPPGGALLQPVGGFPAPVLCRNLRHAPSAQQPSRSRGALPSPEPGHPNGLRLDLLGPGAGLSGEHPLLGGGGEDGRGDPGGGRTDSRGPVLSKFRRGRPLLQLLSGGPPATRGRGRPDGLGPGTYGCRGRAFDPLLAEVARGLTTPGQSDPLPALFPTTVLCRGPVCPARRGE